MIRFLVVALLAAGAGEAVAAQSAAQVVDGQETRPVEVAHLRGLDTLNGIARDIDVRIGESVRFGHLDILVESCRVPRVAPNSDAFAFLVIRDVREAEPRFSGWMFASSPALSALDHPRYDVWVTSCSSD